MGGQQISRGLRRAGAAATRATMKPPARWRSRTFGLAGALLLAASSSAHAQAHESARIEAAYIVNFVRYTEWPPTSFASPQAPVVVVVYRAPAIADALAASGARIGSRPIEVRRARTIEVLRRELSGGHVLYSGADHDAALALAGDLMLTIGGAPGFFRAGGMIAFARQDDRVVFDANLPAIRSAGLELSAKVLALARRVEGR